MRKKISFTVATAMALFIAPIQPAYAIGSCEVEFNDATMACTAGGAFDSCYNAAATAYMQCLDREATVNQ